MQFEQLTENSLFFDCYGGLLTEKQQEIFRLYYEDNLSLGEISEEIGISRQGVHNALKKAEQALKAWDAKLDLLGKMRRNEKTAETMYACVAQAIALLDQNGPGQAEAARTLQEALTLISRFEP